MNHDHNDLPGPKSRVTSRSGCHSWCQETATSPWSEIEQSMIFPKAVVTTGGWTGYASRLLEALGNHSTEGAYKASPVQKKIPECGREGEMPYCDRNVYYPFLCEEHESGH